MLRLLATILSSLVRTSISENSRRQRSQLRLERLEDREVPANFVWTATPLSFDPFWSDSENWNMGTDTAVPGPNDDVYFLGGDNNVPSTNNSVYSVKSLTVAAGYTETITLDIGTLAISGDLSLNGGRLKGHDTQGMIAQTSISESAGGALRWSGGTIDNIRVALGNSAVAHTIEGESEKELANGASLSIGETVVSWTGGNIKGTGGTISVYSFGTTSGILDIRTDASMTAQNGTTNLLSIGAGGTVEKSHGAGTTAIGWDLLQGGILELDSGTVLFSGSAVQNGTAAKTRLNGGNLTVTSFPGYKVQKGRFEGVGTFSGSLIVGVNPDPLEMVDPAFLHPGLGTSYGTLNIIGSYIQNSSGVLQIEVNMIPNTYSSHYSRLVIQGSEQYGLGMATLSGTLDVYDPGCQLSLGSILTFLETDDGIYGTFDQVYYTVPTWQDPNDNGITDKFTALRSDDLTYYYLKVVEKPLIA